MICPPVVGDKPEKGKHGGFWVELLNEKNEMLFHRPISSILNSVEVHSPDGKIQRITGNAGQRVFEVLVPDDETATHVSLVGEELGDTKKRSAKAAAGSVELARFEIPKEQGGKS